jgi:hypothetical protein
VTVVKELPQEAEAGRRSRLLLPFGWWLLQCRFVQLRVGVGPALGRKSVIDAEEKLEVVAAVTRGARTVGDGAGSLFCAWVGNERRAFSSMVGIDEVHSPVGVLRKSYVAHKNSDTGKFFRISTLSTTVTGRVRRMRFDAQRDDRPCIGGNQPDRSRKGPMDGVIRHELSPVPRHSVASAVVRRRR